MTTTTLQGDNTLILPTLDAASVQCIATSPPYYGLRDYGIPPTAWPEVEYTPLAGLPPITIPAMTCCLGLEADPLAYIGHLVYVWRLLRRVLRDDGVCWLNLGDSYAGAGTIGRNDTTPDALARRAEKYGTGTGSGSAIGAQGMRSKVEYLKSKDLLGIPWRAAFALQADGWYLRSDCIWAKPNPMPESVTDRPTKAHEYLFLLAKSERYFYDAEAVAEAQQGDGRKRGRNDPAAGTGRNDAGRVWQDTGRRNRRTVWSIATQPYSGAHFAVMPEALIDPCIRASSRPGDTVLDPYGGSGTVGRVAERLQRNAVLIELNPAYLELQAQRLDGVQMELLV